MLPGGSPTGQSPPSSRNLSRCSSGAAAASEGPLGAPAKGLRWLLDVVKHGVDDGVPSQTPPLAREAKRTSSVRVGSQSGGAAMQLRRRGSVVDDCDAWLHEKFDQLHPDTAAA